MTTLEQRVMLSAAVPVTDTDPHAGHAGVDVAYGMYTAEEFAALEAYVPNSALSTKTLPVQQDGIHESNILTFVLDFKESFQGNTSDIFGNVITTFDLASFGFAANQFSTVTNSILAEVKQDYFDELVGTVAGPPNQDLRVNFMIGDIGVAPIGITEYYYVQIGTGIAGPHSNGTLGVAGGSVVRNTSGVGPNFGIQTGDVVASIFTDAIQSLGGLTPSNALSSGNLTFTTFAVAGTTSHEIGHTLSLSHVNKAGSIQPTNVPPIMGTGAIDLPNQDRIGERSFSLSGFDGENGNAPRFQIQQLVNAVGLHSFTNSPPTISLTNALTSLPENSITTPAITVATIVVTDDGSGTNTLSLSGNDAALFQIVGNSLQIVPGTVFDFETNPLLEVTVSVDDATLGTTPDSSAALSIMITDVNEAPTAVVLSNVVTELPENTDTSTALALADIGILDDLLGTNSLRLSGADAAAFEIVNRTLRLKAGTVLDYETKSLYSVSVQADDPSVGVDPDASTTYVLRITDVNDPPIKVVVSNPITSLPESTNTTSAIKLGTIVVTDDALGAETLSLSGADVASFELSGTELRLKAGVKLDFEAKKTFSVTINVDDPTVGTSSDASVGYTLTITDSNEAPKGVSLGGAITSLAENTSTVNPVKLGDLVVMDDALGSENYQLVGADATVFEIVSGALRLKAGTVLDFETKSSYTATIQVDDPTVGNSPDASVAYTLSITDVNEAPTAVVVQAVGTTINENTVISTPLKVADIFVTDDALGAETFSVSGTDASFFLIDGTALKLKAGTVLNFETKPTYNVTVNANDPTVGGNPDATTAFSLTIGDVNEAPTAVTLTDVVTSLPENTSTASAIKVANIQVIDDALGSESLTLSGTDAALFQIVGTELQLRAGVALNFEAKPSLSVTVRVDDATVGTTPDATVNYLLSVTNANDAPVIANQTFSVRSGVSNGTLVGRVVATDQDAGQVLTYVIVSGNVDNAFSLNASSGELKVANSQALRRPRSFSLVIRVFDNGAPSASKDAVITVNVTRSQSVGAIVAPSFTVSPSLAATAITVTPASQTVTPAKSTIFSVKKTADVVAPAVPTLVPTVLAKPAVTAKKK